MGAYFTAPLWRKGMSIEIAAPPKIVERRSYKEIMKRLIEADGEWLRLGLDDVAPGATNIVKQSRLWQAADSRGLKVQTTVQEGALYVHLLKEQA